MGDIVDLIQEGHLCRKCGAATNAHEGEPTLCQDCMTISCPECGEDLMFVLGQEGTCSQPGEPTVAICGSTKCLFEQPEPCWSEDLTEKFFAAYYEGAY